MPGTGKTATTLEIINNLRKLNNFEFIHINGMSVTNPHLVYTIIYERITGRRINPTSAAFFLDDYFKKKDKASLLKQVYAKKNIKSKDFNKEIAKKADQILVVLIDELDALITKKQTLLYNLFDWPCQANSKLLVISIANTMDLPERLQAKISSRIGNIRVVYEPYNVEQIEEILRSRLKDINIFDKNSIALVSKKVSVYSGDIRRSLQITKRAVEICRQEHFETHDSKNNHNLTKIKMAHIMKAFDELYNSKTV